MCADDDRMTHHPALDALRPPEGVTPGPWRWTGHDTGSIELSSGAALRPTVLAAMRSRPCIVETVEGVVLAVGACGGCRAAYADPEGMTPPRCEKDENLGTVWLRDDGVLRPANHWAKREQSYRSHVAAVAHPDATHIANMDPTTTKVLLKVVELALTALDELTEDECPRLLPDDEPDDCLCAHHWALERKAEALALLDSITAPRQGGRP